MKMMNLLCGLLLSAVATNSIADKTTTDAAIGGGAGGAIGGAIGAEIGGRDGAILGSAVGAALGTAAMTSESHEESDHHHRTEGVTVQVDSGHHHPGAYHCPPGQAKKHRC